MPYKILVIFKRKICNQVHWGVNVQLGGANKGYDLHHQMILESVFLIKLSHEL